MISTAIVSEATLRFALLGLATGALTALVALAILIVYRVSGVLNFAAGATGAFAAFACYTLRDEHGWPGGIAFGAALLVGAGLGLATYGVMAALRGTSLLGRLVATLGLFSALQGLMSVVWGTKMRQPRSLLPDRPIEVAALRIGQDRLILIGVVCILAVSLRFAYSRTLFGLATSAVSENRRVAASSGWSPGRIELVNFTLAGVLAAMASTFLAPIVTLNAAVLSIAVIPALAASLVGRFSSFGVTVAAALGIGVLQSELALFQPDIADAMGVSVPSLGGLPQVVPLVIILVLTVATGRSRPARGESSSRLPIPGTGVISPVTVAVGLVVGAFMLTRAESYADALIVTFGIAIIVASVVVVSGFAGQLSLCQYALAGFGAWVTSRALIDFNWPFVFALGFGVLSTVLLGVLVALPAIRTRGVSLAVVTLALALLFHTLIFTNPALTGGFSGTVVSNPSILGFEFDPIARPQQYAALLFFALAAVTAMVANIRRGSTGRRLIAVRSNERAAAALGISVVGVKLYAFAVGAGIAALGGTLLAFRHANVQFQTFDVFGSILLVQYAVIGGLGWVSGVVAGAIVAPGALGDRLVNVLFPSVDNVVFWLAILSGIGIIHLLRRAPDGIASVVSGALRTRVAGVASLPKRPASPRPGPQMRPSEIEVVGIAVRFGGVIALDDVSFVVRPGEVVGLIGPNGAGKTTLLDVITGFTKQHAGQVLLDGVDVSSWTPERRARAGMARSWQAVEPFDELTVRENLLVGCDQRPSWRYLTELIWPGRSQLTALAQDVVDELGLREVLDEKPSSLPHGVLRLVGIARAIVSNPGVVLLDEPAAGLDRAESLELAAVIRRIAERRGVGVIVIEHDMSLILGSSDRIVALDFGRKIAEGTPQDVQTNPTVIQAYLGAMPTQDPANRTPMEKHLGQVR